MYVCRVFHPRRADLVSSSAAFRAARPSSLQVFGQEIWPLYSSEPSQHSGSQTPSFTCDEGMYAGLWPAFVQWNLPFGQADVPKLLGFDNLMKVPGSSEPSAQSQ